MRARAGFFIGLWLCAFAAGPAWADKRVALVIGNAAYQNVPKLTNPANDAGAMANLFQQAGFEVVEAKRDLNNAGMRRTLRDFSDKTRNADMAVIYFAGHGIEIDGQNYLLPTDVSLARDSDAYDEAITLDRVLQVIEPARNLRLIILDACRDNPFARTMQRTLASRSLGRGLIGVEPGKPNTLIAFAAKAGSTAADGTSGEGNSPFTVALLKHLTTPGLDLRQAFGRVRDDVMKSTGDRQEPFVYGSLGGATVSLVPNERPANSAQPKADPQAAVRKDYELALQLGTREAWQSFLAQYSAGFYADLAKGQLSKIAAEETRAAAAEKAKQAEAERARLAAEGARAGEQAKAAREARTAEEARLAGEKRQHAEQVKVEAAEEDRKVAEKEAERTRLAALPVDTSNTPMSQPEINRSLQTELRRVGCQTGSVSDGWNAAARRSLELFSKHAGMKLDAKLASLDALDAVKGKQARICPLICEHGFRAAGEKCERIVCRPGYAVGDDNTCEKPDPRKPLAKREVPVAPPKREAAAPKAQSGESGQIFCDGGGCRPIPRGCRIVPRTQSHSGQNSGSGHSAVSCN